MTALQELLARGPWYYVPLDYDGHIVAWNRYCFCCKRHFGQQGGPIEGTHFEDCLWIELENEAKEG